MGYELINAVASIATTVGVTFAGWQLVRSVRQQAQALEDGLVNEYRRLLRDLPIDALLGANLPEPSDRESLKPFYLYFDLCNQQAYLYSQRRVRSSTWREWREGIIDQLNKPAFAEAWEHIEARTDGSFQELRSLVAEGRSTTTGKAPTELKVTAQEVESKNITKGLV